MKKRGAKKEGAKKKGAAQQRERRAQVSDRKWILPIDNVSDLQDTCFRVDRQIEDIAKSGQYLTKRWQADIDGLKAFARRALEVATMQAFNARLHQSDMAAGIEEAGNRSRKGLGDSAAAALEAIERVIGRIGPDGATLRSLTAGEIENLRVNFLRQVIEPETAAKATALWNARDVLQSVTTAARAQYKTIKEKRKNEGQTDKHQFVWAFVEMWASITGKKPPVGEDTAFINLIRAAWEDAGHPATSFQRPLRNIALSLTAAEIEKLRDNLPLWHH